MVVPESSTVNGNLSSMFAYFKASLLSCCPPRLLGRAHDAVLLSRAAAVMAGLHVERPQHVRQQRLSLIHI